MSRLRFRRDAGEATGFHAWMACGQSVLHCSARVCPWICSEKGHGLLCFPPHEFGILLKMQPSGTRHTKEVSMCKATVAREKGDTMSGARMGAAPWQIGVLSGVPSSVWNLWPGCTQQSSWKQDLCESQQTIWRGPLPWWKSLDPQLSCTAVRYACFVVPHGKKQRACMQVFPLAVRTCFAHQHLFPIFGLHWSLRSTRSRPFLWARKEKNLAQTSK